jgi:hypothetical protein
MERAKPIRSRGTNRFQLLRLAQRIFGDEPGGGLEREKARSATLGVPLAVGENRGTARHRRRRPAQSFNRNLPDCRKYAMDPDLAA